MSKEYSNTLHIHRSQEDPLEEAMATHSSILAWKFPWTEEPGRFWGRTELDTIEHARTVQGQL